MVGVTIIATAFLGKTTLGRYIYAVGGNEEAVRLAGINVNGVKMFVYTASGFLARSPASSCCPACLCPADCRAGQELPVIAASIIGGTSLVGGEGTALGAVLGAAIVGVLENGIVLLGINPTPSKLSPGRPSCSPLDSISGRNGASIVSCKDIGPSRDGAGAHRGVPGVLARCSDDAGGAAQR